MKTMKQVQRSLSCACGRTTLARGLCTVCYTLRRQDEAYFGGLRELALERDGHRCRGCGRRGAGKWSLVVHHRRPGRSVLSLMLTLCPGCHARVHRTQTLRAIVSPLLRMLWRELHPGAHEQRALDFRTPVAEPEPTFVARERWKGTKATRTHAESTRKNYDGITTNKLIHSEAETPPRPAGTKRWVEGKQL